MERHSMAALMAGAGGREMSRHWRPGPAAAQALLQVGGSGAGAQLAQLAQGSGKGTVRLGGPAATQSSVAPWACSCPLLNSLELFCAPAGSSEQETHLVNRGCSRLQVLASFSQVNLLAAVAWWGRTESTSCAAAACRVAAWAGAAATNPPACPPRLLEGYLVGRLCDGSGRQAVSGS